MMSSSNYFLETSRELRVANLNGDQCTISAFSHWTADTVKDVLAPIMHIPKYKQCLLLDAQELADDCRVADLPQGEFVQLSIIRRAVRPASPTPAAWGRLAKMREKECLYLGHERGRQLELQQNDLLLDLGLLAPANVHGQVSDDEAEEPEDGEPHLVQAADDGNCDDDSEGMCWGDRCWVMFKLSRNALHLEHAWKELQADYEVVLIAVRLNGLALAHAAPCLQADRSIVLEAMRSDRRAIDYASQQLRAEFLDVTNQQYTDQWLELDVTPSGRSTSMGHNGQ